VTVKFKKGTGSKANTFVEEGTSDAFQLNSSGRTGEAYMTAAIRARPDPDAEPVHFNAQLKGDPSTTVTYKSGLEGLRFIEENGSRFIQAHQLGLVYVPSTGAVIVALLLNFLHFLIWFIAFWPILQFTRGHSFILMTVFALLMMLIVLPLLFDQTTAAKAAPAAEGTKTAWVQDLLSPISSSCTLPPQSPSPHPALPT
jgi:hypothetical protein